MLFFMNRNATNADMYMLTAINKFEKKDEKATDRISFNVVQEPLTLLASIVSFGVTMKAI